MKFIIYASRYTVDSGGTIVLHMLCHILNTLGYSAYMWPVYKPVFNKQHPVKSFLLFFKYIRKSIHRKYSTNPSWNTPQASYSDLNDEPIVIYSEIVDGNPLGVKNIIRWLLHKPGFHNKSVKFTTEELIFGFGEKFSTEQYPITQTNTLLLFYIMKDIYKQTNFKERAGSCHMIRKGKNKKLVHKSGSLLVDGMTHEELAKIFNEKKFFISYDPYTYYSIYAALCGCISIVIPDENTSKEEWHPKLEDTYGLAYGLDDIDYATRTRPLLLEYIKQQEKENIISVENFVIQCENYFTKES